MLGEDQQVATADRLLDPERFLHQELAFHHRNPPVALSADDLAGLKLVAEVTQLAADDDPLGRIGQAVEAGSCRTGEYGLADTVDELSLKSIRIEAEQQHVHTRPPVRCGVRTQLPFDARLDLASDDRGGEPGHGFGRRSRPAG